MAAEVAAFLLKQKLQNLLASETIVYPRLKRKIHESISTLQELLNFLKDKDSFQQVDGVNSQALPFIYTVEDAVDTVEENFYRLLKNYSDYWTYVYVYSA